MNAGIAVFGHKRTKKRAPLSRHRKPMPRHSVVLADSSSSTNSNRRERRMQLAKLCAIAIFLAGYAIQASAEISKAPPEKASTTSASIKQDNSPSVVQVSGTEFLKIAAADAANQIDKAARERDDHRWTTLFAVFGSIIGALSFLGFKTMEDFNKKALTQLKEDLSPNNPDIKSAIDLAVQQITLEALNKKFDEVNREFSLYRMANIAQALSDDTRTGFTNTERDSVVEILNSLSQVPEMRNRTDFSAALEKIVLAFAKADLEFYIDRIHESLAEVCCENRIIVQTLLEHFGQRLMGAIDLDASVASQFDTYAKAAQRHKLYPMVLPITMAKEHFEKKDGWEDRLKALWDDFNFFDTKQRQIFFTILDKYSDASKIARRPTAQATRIATRFKSFTDSQADRIAAFRNAQPVVAGDAPPSGGAPLN